MFRSFAVATLALCAACNSNSNGVPTGASGSTGTVGSTGTIGTTTGSSTTSGATTSGGGCGAGCPSQQGCYQGACYPLACPSGPCGEGALCVLGSCVCIATCTDGGTSSATTGSGTTSGTGTTSGSSGVDAGPVVETLAGNGNAGFKDGTGGPSGLAEFSFPKAVAIDASGNVYVADTNNGSVRKVDPSGNVTTLAGDGGDTDWDGGTVPAGVAVDSAGNVYVALENQNRIQKIDHIGTLTTLAGNGTPGWADGTGGPTGTAEFNTPNGIAVDDAGAVYVADYANNRIRKIDSSGNVTTLAGNGSYGYVDGTGGPSGTAQFRIPTGVAVDLAGDVYVADYGNCNIRRIDPDGGVTTLAGSDCGFADGTGGPTGTAKFSSPYGVTVDKSNNVYVADTFNDRIRKIDTSGNVTTLAGSGDAGWIDGPVNFAEFNSPWDVAVDAIGDVYVADPTNNRVRVVRP